MLSWVGIVWDLRTPPKHIRDGGKIEKQPAAATAPQLAATESVPPRVAADRIP